MLRRTCHDAIEDEQELDRCGEGGNYHGSGRDQTTCHHHSTMTEFIDHNTRQRACNHHHNIRYIQLYSVDIWCISVC